MNVYQVRGYPNHHFFVKHDEWQHMIQWLVENGILWLQESSGPHGIGFSIRDYKGQKGHEEWFRLKWLLSQ